MATAGEETVRRLRLRRGRVMHAVTGLSSGIPGWLRPVCKRVSATPAEDWTDERLWYPDCVHCDRKLATPVPCGSRRRPTSVNMRIECFDGTCET